MTVVSDTATDADAIASALSVMGAEEGLNWIENTNGSPTRADDVTYQRAVRFEEDGTEVVGGPWYRYVWQSGDGSG